MRRAFFVFGVFQVGVRYLNQKGGAFWYYRRIPEELRAHYQGKRHIRKSLRTKDVHIATKKVAALAAADDALWASLRTPQAKDQGLTTQQNREAARTLLATLGLAPGDAHRPEHVRPDFAEIFDDHFEGRYGQKYMGPRHDPRVTQEELVTLLNPIEREAMRLVLEDPKSRRFLLSDALDVYLKGHDKGEQEKFARDNRRAIQHVIGAVGDLPLEAYRREHANAVRESLIAKGGKSATVRRDLNRIKAVFNVGLVEFDLGTTKNPFEKLRIPNEDRDAKKREPFTTKELQTINKACRARSDDIRQIIALQADTGARLQEIVGLRIEDVVLDHPVPHIHIRPHVAVGRTLKTDTSERRVPLVGMALWAAERALRSLPKARRNGNGWLFGRYASDSSIKATNAANAINKWLKAVTKSDKTSHSFRHSMRDRLRYVNAPQDIQDAIGGWGSRTVGMGYGEGYHLEQLRCHLEKVVLSDADRQNA